MSEIDDKILEALNAEEKEVMCAYGKELGMFGLIAESFKGKFGTMVVMVFLLIVIFAVLLIYSAINFFAVKEMALKLNWMAIGITLLIIISLLRLWYWMELNRLAITRELKRLELQVSLLTKTIKGTAGQI